MSNIDPAANANFLSLFSKLKHSADDRPDCLREWAKTDQGLRQLCDDVSWAAYLLAKSERSDRQLFTGPVDLVFIKTWRDYEDRYEFALAEIFLDFLGPELVPGARPAPEAYTRWEIADDTASSQAKAIETAIDFAIDQVADDLGEFPEGFLETIEDGARAWEGLKRQTSFDLKGVFRRRELVPFILIPKHVSDKLGTNIGKLTLLTSLQQAHDAFIFGAPLAALGSKPN
jgi:hypothetical protein